MSYRDDLDAAVTRADAVDRDNKKLVDDNARLAVELAEAKDLIGSGAVWLTTKRGHFVLAGAGIAFAIGGLAIGIVMGRSSVSCPAWKPNTVAPVPSVMGAMIGDGPDVPKWSLTATTCVPRSDGIELTAANFAGRSVWLTNATVEIEADKRSFELKESDCYTKFKHEVVQRENVDPPTYDGFIELDCNFGTREQHEAGTTNVIRGRIEFRNCRP